ncbi:MAG: hypothetical protein ARM1_0199 [Candidatus Micrarchaeota archaeon]|nr:MAG: hypothetical protein ARM1_0199 [Candidatus Micrarchaeota archaeon]
MKRFSYILIFIAVILILILAYFGYSRYSSNKYYFELEASYSNTTYPFQIDYINITVFNLGNTTIKGLPVGYYEDNNLVSVFYVNATPHNGSLYKIPFYTSAPGLYNISIVADPAQLYKAYIYDRSKTEISLHINVSRLGNSNLLYYLPSNNVSNAYIFFAENTTAAAIDGIASSLSGSYSYLNLINNVTKALRNLDRYMPYIEAGYINYKNGSYALSDYFVGPNNQNSILQILQRSSIPFKKLNSSLYQLDISNITSCYTFNRGWNIIVSYNGLCSSLKAYNYTININNTNATTLRSLVTRAIYKGSINTGSILYYNNSSYRFSNFNIIGDNIYISTAYNHKPIENMTASCFGNVTDYNGISICTTTQIAPSNTVIIKQQYSGKLYNFSLTTITNTSVDSILSAIRSGIDLIDSLSLNKSAVSFESQFKNSCSIIDADLSCSFNRYNSLLDRLNITLTNRYNSSIYLSTVYCYSNTAIIPNNINSSIAPNNSIYLNLACSNSNNISVAGSYKLLMIYTINKKLKSANGTVNYTLAI